MTRTIIEWLEVGTGLIAVACCFLLMVFFAIVLGAIFFSFGCWMYYGAAHTGAAGTAWLFQHCG